MIEIRPTRESWMLEMTGQDSVGLSRLGTKVTKPSDKSCIRLWSIFVLEEFDLFATHSRQTILYNLFICLKTTAAKAQKPWLRSEIKCQE